MGIDVKQLRDLIIRPAISAIGKDAGGAVELLMGTAAVETNLGKYIAQVRGPAMGIYQMEKASYEHIWNKHIESNVTMKSKVRIFLGYEGMPSYKRLSSDLLLSTIMARLYYYNVPEKLPDANDLKGLARYYKIYWNTVAGKSTEKKFIDSYNKYVK